MPQTNSTSFFKARMKNLNTQDYFTLIGVIEIFGITLLIGLAFAFQFILGEIPCPLCLLQRLGLLSIAFGFLLNIRFGIKPIHYSLSLLSALLTSFVALRHIALHIKDPIGYGSLFLGVHMYTWVFVLCIIAIVYLSIKIGFGGQNEQFKMTKFGNKSIRIFSYIAFYILVLMIFANVAATFVECGFSECKDNPTNYVLLV